MIYPPWRLAPELASERQRLRAAGLRLVFTNGCFDLLHPGHLQTLESARQLGDRLLVAINTDASVSANKGPGRPLTPEHERAELLDGPEFVDYVTLFGEPTPLEIIRALLPDVLVKGADWGEGAVVGQSEVEAAGGQVLRLPLAPGYSTSAIEKAIQTHTRLGL